MKVPTPAAAILARAGNDPTLDPARRMTALAQLGILYEAGEAFVEVPDKLRDVFLTEKPKEEFIWRNGARVKKR
jgi:hypothetical protein